MLICKNISLCNYNKIIFRNLSFSLLPSSIIYLKGLNGSGKTSFLRIVAGIMNPSSGSLFFNGNNINNIRKPYSVYIGHDLAIKKNLTVLEMIHYYSSLFNSMDSLEACIYYLGLYSILEEKCENLSHGNLKKIAMARLMLFKSDLWLLDELESNLDESNLDLLKRLIVSKANSGGIIIIASHQESNIDTAQILNLQDFI